MTLAEERNWHPMPVDGYPTPTSDLQTATEKILQDCLESQISGDSAHIPALQKNAHVQFLLRNLVQGFPARYTSQDASQPWLIFWTLQGFSVLGVGLDEQTKTRAIDTLLALQHPSGGFAGGPGQFPHLLPTYAAVCAMAIVGKGGEGGGWEKIDREGLYDFFMSLKQPDGSFLVSHYGEVDVRGIYCLLAVATMLDLLTPELLEGTPEFIAACQTYEGGFCNASFPDWALGLGNAKGKSFSTDSRPPLGEAHGGYTFCATASWILLQPYIQTCYSDKPKPHIQTSALLRWLTQMQGSEIELGGFKGRTNKLVDGCYSWWVGGCVVLVEGLLGLGEQDKDAEHEQGKSDEEDAWDDVDDSLFNRRALQEYVLFAAQHSAGGLVDKPPKGPDAYHTLYCLSGLSAAQHHMFPSGTRRKEVSEAWKDGEKPADAQLTKLRHDAFVSSLSWVEEEGTAKYIGGEQNRLNATHPLSNLTVTHIEGIMAHFYGQSIPRRGFSAKKSE
ncbi:terpenoid cyclases/protein prenyltransferase alpha-alpha toroid [Irpex rosettiformis]|uniref:Terpenoid cyclases/protein prenyltransferase alpha-alpha toroid n=1 Tax=Irpex rosettiformis TaxID=378272 RepID=A0ACB8TVE2_9APHY|nr:terpenoid cyclases/protein prenyltransferase alpha-alpha toroid [Irpex rosettiformis]